MKYLKNILKNKDNKILIINIINTFLIKGGAVIISFLTLPAYLNYFQEQQILGVWFTILSVLTWIFSFDLGIGNGLRNNLVKSFTDNNSLQIRKYISSAYIIIGAFILLIYIVFCLLFRDVDWNIFFNINEDVVTENVLEITLFILFTGIMLQFLLKLINSILYAMQKSSLNNFLSLISSVIILLYVSIFSFDNLTSSLIWLAIAYVIATNIPLLISSIIIFATSLKNSKPNIKHFSKLHAQEVLKLGGVFFWVQIMYMILTTTNEILITWFVGPEKVVDFQIYNRIFTLSGTIFTLMLVPIWSMVTKAFSENNYVWIKKLYNIFNYLSILVISIQFLLIPFVPFVVKIWLNDNSIKVDTLYSVTFAILGSMIIWIGANNSFANGFGKLKTQVIFFTLGAIIKVPLAWYLTNLLDSWIGVVLASILSLSLYCIIQPIWLRIFINKKINEKEE